MPYPGQLTQYMPYYAQPGGFMPQQQAFPSYPGQAFPSNMPGSSTAGGPPPLYGKSPELVSDDFSSSGGRPAFPSSKLVRFSSPFPSPRLSSSSSFPLPVIHSFSDAR